MKRRFYDNKQSIATAGFMDDAHNLILVGGTGTGKTHLATALGVAAIHLGKRVRFFNAVDLVNLLEHEKKQNKTKQNKTKPEIWPEDSFR